MKNAFRLSSFALALSACSQGALPNLPDDSIEPVPTVVRLIEPPSQLAAGAWASVSAQVLDQFDQPLAGQTVALAVLVPEGEAPGLVPGLGNSCSTGLAGEPCPIALESKGPMGRYTVVLTSGAVPPAEHVIEVIPAAQDAELSIQIPGRPALRFRNGERDLLAFQAPVNLLASGDAVAVELRLTDRFGNPVPAMLRAEWQAEQPAQPPAAPDAGPVADSGLAPEAGAGDTSAPDAAPGDVAPGSDAAMIDVAAAADVAILDASAQDAAFNASDAGAAPAGSPLTLSLGADCSAERALSAQAMPTADGRLVLCLAGGSVIGAAQVRLSAPGVLLVDDGEGGVGEALALPTNTLPSGQVRLRVQGQPQLRCEAGAVTNELVVQVVDNAEPANPVPGQEVRTSFTGLTGVVPEVAFSGTDGRLALRGQCPSRRVEAPQLSLYLANDPSQALSFDVEIQIGAVASVRLSLDNAAPGDPSLEVGSVGALRARLLDDQGNTVPQGRVTWSLPQVLAGALVLASPACGAQVGASLSGLTCQADGDGEVLLELLAGGALPGVPLPIQARGHNAGGDDPVSQLDLSLVAGRPAQLTLSPNGRMAAVVGADAGEVTVRVSDAGGNPIAGVQVELSAPQAVLLDPQAGSQNTNAEGLATWRVAQVAQAGQHTLNAVASVLGLDQGEDPIVLRAQVVVDTSAGQATALQLRNRDGEVVPADQGEQAWVLGGAVGEDLPGVYTLARINGRGGVLTGAGGLALQVLSQPSDGCAALANLASAQFSDQGLLRLGDGLELVLGTVARSCRYRVSVGGVHHDLVLNQTPGTPVGGTFERNVGTVLVSNWQAAPGRLDPRPGYEVAPGMLPLAQTHALRLRNPQDAFGNAVALGTVLQPAAQNAWVSPELPIVRAVDGASVVEFTVAGGASLGEDAVVTASSAQGWEQPPMVRFEARQDPPFVEHVTVTGIDRKTYRYGGITAAQGRVRTDGEGEHAPGAQATELLSTGVTFGVDRFAAQDLLYRPAPGCTGCAAERPYDNMELYLAPEHEAHAQLVKLTFRGAQRVVFERSDPHGRCVQGSRCSRALVTLIDDGRGALERPQVVGRFPLTRISRGGGFFYNAYVPVALLSGGGIFGAAIEADAGEGEALVSNVRPVTGKLRPWLRPRQLKVLPPPPPDGVLEHFRQAGQLPAGWQGFARTLDVQRIQADDDDEEELLLCGDDVFGGWVAIAQVDEARAARGANPFGDAGTVQAVRTYLTPGFLGDPNSGQIPSTLRMVTGVAARPSGCDFVRHSPMDAMILSFGRPGSQLYAGIGDLVATPVRLGAPVPTDQANLGSRRLNMRSDRNAAGVELAWSSWLHEGQRVSGPVVELGYQDPGMVCRFAATAAGQSLALAAGDCSREYTLSKPAYAQADDLDLSGTRTRSSCDAFACASGALEIDRSIGRSLGATDWGGAQGLLRFSRHTPYLAWYLPHRYDETCRAQDGRMICSGSVCGDGQLSYGEVCEPGAGCTNTCRLVGYEGERPPPGLAVSFAPMELQDDADPEPEVRLTRALAAAPLTHKMDADSGDLLRSTGRNLGLAWGNWYQGRANCRRLGGDLPTERQWEGLATAGAGGFERGLRPHPWGRTPAHQAASIAYYQAGMRSAEAWLATTPEGLADLTSSATSYGEWTMGDQGERPLGENPQNGPLPGSDYCSIKGGGTSSRNGFPVRARSNHGYRGLDVRGSSRCVWLRPRP